MKLLKSYVPGEEDGWRGGGINKRGEGDVEEECDKRWKRWRRERERNGGEDAEVCGGREEAREERSPALNVAGLVCGLGRGVVEGF